MTTKKSYLKKSKRINRNIVECKDRYYSGTVIRADVLIETLWNVKIETAELQTSHWTVLIETLWNVKLPSLC